MAVDFLTKEQKEQYGKFIGEPNEIQLTKYFHLDESDLSLILGRRGNHNRLGFALQLTSVRFLGTFVSDLVISIPVNVHVFIAKQLSISDLGVLKDYAYRETTKREHTAIIRKHYGYHDFSERPWTYRLSRLLYIRSWFSNERPSLLFDFATSWLIQNKILLPGVSRLTRLISEIRERTDNRLWKRLSALPTNNQVDQLNQLFTLKEESRQSCFDFYRKGPVTISGPAFNSAVDRYLYFKSFKMHESDLSNIPPIRMKNVARYAGIISMHKIMRMPDIKKTAMLVAYVKSFEIISLDDALDIFDLLISDISTKAKNTGIKKRLRRLKDLDRSALKVAEACSLLIASDNDSKSIKKLVYSKVPKSQLIKSIEIINELAKPLNENINEEMVEQYGRVRRFLLKLLDNFNFDKAPSGDNVVKALNYLKSVEPTRKQFLENPPLEIISKPWQRIVFDKDKRVKRQGYTLCVLEKVQDALRRRDIYISKSDRWGDPRSKLINAEQWRKNRVSICNSLGHHIDSNKAMESLEYQLDQTYKKVAENFSNNNDVSIDNSGKHQSLTISSLEKLEEPKSLQILRNEVLKLIPKIDLTELLLEIHKLTGFAKEFTHISESTSKAADISVSVCAVLLGEACNIGLDPFLKLHISALTRYRLSWVKQNYVREETLTKSNARLVDFHSSLDLPKHWGGGDVASADGMRFVTPIKTINAGPNRKYFGSSKGITWYNFVSDQFSGFHGIVIPGTLRDSIFILQGLLEQQTGLTPKEIMTDTAGTSYLVFGLFWLLGYQFSPRFADAGESIFWRVDKEACYGVLDKLSRGVIKKEKIHESWDDMMRMAGSLKLNTVQASELIKSLLKSDKPSSLTQAIIEVGKINQTLHLLNYVDDKDYRRRILTQLNRGEGRHSVARSICHGKRGEIRKRYREGQEDQLGALGLVTNAVVLWNTIYMQAAIDHLKKNTDIEVKDDDIARLSPLIYRHINMLGHYSFNLSEDVIDGKLRPLNIDESKKDNP